jgi:hypothetical protein
VTGWNLSIMTTTNFPKILTDFFSENHTGFNKEIKIEKNVFSTNLPIIELNLNLDTAKILADLKDFVHETPINRQLPYETVPRVRGWGVTDLWLTVPTTKYPYLMDLYYKKYYNGDLLPAIPKDENKYPNIVKQLNNINIDRCRASVITAGGYLYPHRDISLNPTPMNYMWIPLNNPVGSELGVYPVGKIPTKLGYGYLLNQENYVHAVINNSSSTRHVLVCYLSDEQPSAFVDLVTQSIKQQYKVIQ